MTKTIFDIKRLFCSHLVVKGVICIVLVSNLEDKVELFLQNHEQIVK